MVGKKIKPIIIILFFIFIFYLFFIFQSSFFINNIRYFTLVDDAMISMRYARNLSDGYGLVWNIGEKPIEGFTNLGWTLIMAFIHLFPIPDNYISLIVMIIGVLILILNLIIYNLIIFHLFPNSKYVHIIATILIGFYFPLIFWTLRGMEVGLLCLIISATYLLILRNNSNAVFLFFIGPIIRFDIGSQLFLLFTNSKKIIHLGALLLGYLGLTIFRYFYFSYPLPNTYYLKVEGVSLLERINVGFTTLINVALLDIWFLLLLTIILFFITKEKIKVLYLFSLFFIQVIYSVYVGGDYAENLVGGANRFLIQGMPYLIIISSYAIEQTGEKLFRIERLKLIYIFSIFLLALIFSSGSHWIKWIYQNSPMLNSDISRVEKGLLIKNLTEDDAIIAAHAVGQISYYSHRNIIDLLGKSDSVIAFSKPVTEFRPGHNKWDYKYSIIDKNPDLVADNWGQLENFLINYRDLYQYDDSNDVWINTSSQKIFSK